MKKSDLRVLKGGLTDGPDAASMKFVNAYATNSRLMGVFAVYIKWDFKGEDFHQFFYIETTEAGIEMYKGVVGDNSAAVFEAEQSMMGGLGAEKVDLTEREARMIIREYAAYNKKFGEKLPDGLSEYSFLLDESAERDNERDDEREWERLFAKICVAPSGEFELINYFLMRYYAADHDAVRYLSAREGSGSLPPEPWSSADTLCLNKIKPHKDGGGSVSYVCESLLESDMDHRIVVSDIEVSGGKISRCKVISNFAISGAETAMKLERPEFITVYELAMDPEKAIEYLDARYLSAMQRDTESGRLYLRFNDDNEHMKGSVYRLNDDVKGMIYVTDESQLILAAYSLPLIYRLEREAQSWPFFRRLNSIAKYEFKEDIFYDFVRSDMGDFVHYVNEVCDFDPDGV